MKARVQRIFSSQYMVMPIFLLKLIIYYILIDVNLLRNFWVLGSILVFGVLYFALSDSKWKGHRLVFLLVYVLFSVVMFADSMYYNYYNQTVSVKQLWQAANVAKVPQSFIATLIPASFILILDIPVVYYFFRRREREENKVFAGMRKGIMSAVCVAAILALAINPFGFGFFTKINSVGFFSNHIRDIYLAVTEPFQKNRLQEEEVLQAVGELSDNPQVKKIVESNIKEMKDPLQAALSAGMAVTCLDGMASGMAGETGGTEVGVRVAMPKLVKNKDVAGSGEDPDGGREVQKLKGHNVAKGRNLIVIQIEALQNMMIGAEYNGQVLTPNLNALIGEDSLYFDHYYTNIGKGNTADAEFSTMNSLYPVIDRECYELYQQNTYDGLPWMLREQGYRAFAVHGYLGDFWNRNYAYPYQGFEDYYSMEDLDDSDVIGLGISDESMFGQTVELLKEQTGPYFAFLITLTNHHPYQLPEEQWEIELAEEHVGTKFGSYLETVRYTDEVIGAFIQELKDEGLYDNTVIAMYGDHHGLNKNMDNNGEVVGGWLGREYDYDEMLRIPLIIHIPGLGYSETVERVGGQVDFLPTIANLMGIKLDHPYILGRDLYNADQGFVAFTAYLFEGSFAKDGVMFEISREGLFEGSRAWEIGTGKELPIEDYYEDYEKAVRLKQTSKEILEQNLLQNHVTHEVDPYVPPEEGEEAGEAGDES